MRQARNLEGVDKNPPLMSKFVIFSVVLFFAIVVAGSIAFIFAMRQIISTNKGGELSNLLEIKRLQLEAFVNSEVSLALMVADSPPIRHYFTDPGNPEMEAAAIEEIASYRHASMANSVFWINDIDKLFYNNEDAPFLLDVTSEDNYWYTKTLNETESFNLNINYNPDLNVTNLWINAPVFNNDGKPLGIVGIGIDLSTFLDIFYEDHTGNANFYFFNDAGEITGAKDIELVAEKRGIADELSYTDVDIIANARNLRSGEMLAFDSAKGKVVISTVPLPDWYAVVVSINSISDYYSAMTTLFVLTQILIAVVLVVFNVFIAGLIKPLRKSIDAAEEANLAKSSFLSSMSHELRTPLNVIIGLTDLSLEESDLSEDVRGNLLSVSNAGGTLLSIVNDILDISKIESGKLTFVPIQYDTPSLLNDTGILVNTYIGEKPIEFRLNIKENLPAVLFGDEIRVKQIMNNLLSNAVKYSHEGMVELSVSCERCEGTQEDVWMDIAVKDTGIGIREEAIKKLFTNYYQADVMANRKTESAGLGLAITRSMAEMMGGYIEVESEYGKGTTFRVRIKQGYVNDKSIGAAVADNLRSFSYSDAKRLTSNHIVRSDLSGASVLVVDDIQNNLDVAAGLMRKYNLRVDCAESGFEAIDILGDESHVYNAVFMDHMMPEMDGVEAARQIREIGSEYARNIPIIALTANAVAGMEQMFLDNGFQDFLSKPIDIFQLDKVLEKWVRDMMPEQFSDARKTAGAPEILSESLYDDGAPGSIVIDIPGVESQNGVARYGDVDIYIDILRSFAASTPMLLEKLREVTPETLGDCVINAHGLKGSSANIGAEQVRSAAYELEIASRNGDLDTSLRLVGPLLENAEKLVADVNSWFTQFDRHSAAERKNAPDHDVLLKLRESCKAYDMTGIDEAMDELEEAVYDTGGDLVVWLREKVDIMELDEIIERLEEL